MQNPNDLLFIGGAFFCTLLFLLLIGTAVAGSSGGNRRLKRRLGRVTGASPAGAGAGSAPALRLLNAESRTPGLDKLMLRLLPNPQVLQQRLARTGRPITIGHYFLWIGGVALAVTSLVTFFVGLSLLPSLLIGVLLGLALPHFVVGWLGKRRLSRFNALFPDAIDLIVRAIKSGLPITEAIVTVGAEVADPVGEEFRKIEGGLKMGRTLEDVLWEIASRLDLPEFRFFVISLSVQRQTGGNLAETLDNLSEILRRRRQMTLKIRAFTSEARASALILGSLPFVVTGMIVLTTPAYIDPLFTDFRGWCMLAVAGSMLLTGIVIMAKMIKFDI